MTIKSFSDYLFKDKGDLFKISSREFVEEEFFDFSLRPIGAERIEVSDVLFDRCVVQSGVCVIRKGVVLRNVVMSDFLCRGGLHISAEAGLENCIISDNKSPSMLVIRSQLDE